MASVQSVIKACRIGDLESLKSILSINPQLIDQTDNQLGWNGLFCSVMCGHIDITKYLIQSHANVNIKNCMGETPLHQAVESTNIKLVKLLLKSKADPNAQQNDGETPLHLAVCKDNYKLVCILLEFGAELNVQNFMYGRTCVHNVMETGNTKIFLEMLKYNPDMHVKDKSGLTPEDLGRNAKCNIIRTVLRITPSQNEPPCLSQQLSPTYTRCNSDASSYTETKFFDSKIGHIEMMHKRIRDTVKSSLDLTRKLDHSGNSTQDAETERTATENKPSLVEARPDMYRWLKTIRLVSEYELLLKAGYDDVAQLVKQMRTAMPLTESSLIKIGMNKPGHRKRLLLSLSNLASSNKDPSVFSQMHCCLNFPSGLWSSNMISIEKWLQDLSLVELAEYFKHGGFEEVEDFMNLIGTPYELDDYGLTEIGIDKPGYRHRILAKIREQSGVKKNDETIIEKTSNNVACELCNII